MVVALFAVLVGIAAWNLRPGRDSASAKGLADSVAQEFLWARSRAQSSGQPVAVALPSNAGSLSHCQSVYALEGTTNPRVTRVSNYAGEFPDCVLFSGFWPLDSAQLGDPTSTNSMAPPPLGMRAEGFDPALWGLPDPQEPCLIFLPSGAVVGNRMAQFDGAYHLVACRGVAYGSGNLGGVSLATPSRIGPCHTVTVSLGGEVKVTPGLCAGTLSPGPGFLCATAAAAPPAIASGANQNPTGATVQVTPRPVNLPPGVDATVALGSYLTLQLAATDPDGDRLDCSFTCSQGTVSSTTPVPMAWNGSQWEGTWEWRPPLGATPGTIYVLSWQIRDPRSGSVSGLVGATGRVEVVGGGKILFMSNRDGSWDLFSMNPDGTEVTCLAPLPTTNEYIPRWSPDGSKIAFIADFSGRTEMYTVNVDGTNLKQLTSSGAATCTWLPDGTRLLYVRPNGLNPDTYIMSADGSNDTFHMNHLADATVEVTWRSDESVGIIARSQGAVSQPPEDLFILNPDQTVGANLTATPGDDEAPVMAPDNNGIVWQSNRSGNYEIYYADFDGLALSNVTNLTNNPAADTAPVWSPDGRYVLFTSNRAGNYDIWKLDRSTGIQTRLTSDPGWDMSPSWRPGP